MDLRAIYCKIHAELRAADGTLKDEYSRMGGIFVDIIWEKRNCNRRQDVKVTFHGRVKKCPCFSSLMQYVSF